jgi:hypothetical protein
MIDCSFHFFFLKLSQYLSWDYFWYRHCEETLVNSL